MLPPFRNSFNRCHERELSIVASLSSSVFVKSAGIGQGERHKVLGFELAEAAAEAVAFAEFFAAVGAAEFGCEKRWHRVPTVARENAWGAMVAGHDQHIGLERVDARDGGVELLDAFHF